MASMFEQPQNGMLFLGGQKISGSDIRDQNGRVPSVFPLPLHEVGHARKEAGNLPYF